MPQRLLRTLQLTMLLRRQSRVPSVRQMAQTCTQKCHMPRRQTPALLRLAPGLGRAAHAAQVVPASAAETSMQLRQHQSLAPRPTHQTSLHLRLHGLEIRWLRLLAAPCLQVLQLQRLGRQTQALQQHLLATRRPSATTMKAALGAASVRMAASGQAATCCLRSAQTTMATHTRTCKIRSLAWAVAMTGLCTAAQTSWCAPCLASGMLPVRCSACSPDVPS